MTSPKVISEATDDEPLETTYYCRAEESKVNKKSVVYLSKLSKVKVKKKRKILWILPFTDILQHTHHDTKFCEHEILFIELKNLMVKTNFPSGQILFLYRPVEVNVSNLTFAKVFR